MNKKITIVVSGPNNSGKSTIAREIFNLLSDLKLDVCGIQETDGDDTWSAMSCDIHDDVLNTLCENNVEIDVVCQTTLCK